jgi:V8-like Glu-specific endopeptidase
VLDSPVDIIRATIQIEQPIGSGGRTVGTGFLISAKRPDGTPETVLVTANHVLAQMPGLEAKIGYRTQSADGVWAYTPQDLKIRDDAGQPLWTHHPARDVAVMKITAPEAFARAAIPAGYLASETAFDEQDVTTGDELMVLGFPRGVAANNAGFPILRSGRVASYPLSPAASPTFLLDFAVFPGNSGGPVFLTSGVQRVSSAPAKPLIAGLLTQQVELGGERLEIGIITHATYITQTIAMMDPGLAPPAKPPTVATVADSAPIPGAVPAAATTPTPDPWTRSAQAVKRAAERFAQAASDGWSRFTQTVVAWFDGGPAYAGRDTRRA